MQWFFAHWQTVAVSVLSVAEIVSLFVKGNGTLAGIIGAISNLPGVKDPKIGQ